MALRSIFIAFLAVGWLSGCGGQAVITDPEQVETLHGKDSTDITFWHSYSDEETRVLEEQLIPEFERLHPDIRVHSINVAVNNELRNTLISLASSYRGPDVVRIELAWVPEFTTKRLLVPLNEYFGDDEDILPLFHKEAMRVGFDQEQLYSLPLDIYVKSAIFNRELLEQAGYSEPPRTLQEVIMVARQNHYTIGLGGWEPWDTLPYIYSLGGAMINDDFTKSSGFLNSDNTVHAVSQLKSLYKEKLLHFSSINDRSDNWSGVKTGNVLMTDEGPWYYSKLERAELDRALKQTIPITFPSGSGSASIMGGNHLVIMKGSQAPAQAWTFMKWMTGKEAQLTMAATGLIPTNQEARFAWTVNRDSYLYPFVEATDDAFLRPPVENWGNIEQIYTGYMSKIFLDEMTVQAGLDRAAAEIDVLLNDNN
ncbi:extracellular solute-binding protein [Paenibacillus sp. N4]|uniref:extracellular solute-binding protein n=1 Tax=Paenibacillus vietnamensis TaxID=2590547 RepID=UPI001CD0E6BB|nr:extracellular solute-binding protein [Paenibacillus vietnamensis]MCA0754222.1 extracellular solute-binding protein [Paenibacillus vietnamensis]